MCNFFFQILHWRVFSLMGKWQSLCLVNRYICFLLVFQLFTTPCVISLHWELNYCLWNMTHCCIYIFPSHQFENLATLHYCFLLLAINEWWSSLEKACTIYCYNVNVMKRAEQKPQLSNSITVYSAMTRLRASMAPIYGCQSKEMCYCFDRIKNYLRGRWQGTITEASF